MKFEQKLKEVYKFIYHSRNLLMKFEVFVCFFFILSTTVEIY